MNKFRLKSLRAFQKIDQIKKREDEKIGQNKYSARMLKKIFRAVAIIIFTLVIGGTGGIIIDRYGLPHLLVQFPELNRYEFLKNVNERTVTIEKTVETKISEDQATIEAIKKIMPSVVTATFSSKIKSDEPKNKDINFPASDEKIGFILTSDGIVISKTDRPLKKDETVRIKFQNNIILDAQWINFDRLTGIAVFKVNADNLPMVTFGDSDSLELGEKLIAANNKAIMDGLVSQFEFLVSDAEKNKTNAQKVILITKKLPDNFYGAPLINIKGEVVGISQGENLVIPINKIKEFIDKVLSEAI